MTKLEIKEKARYCGYILLAVGILCYWGYGVYSFSTNLKEDIKAKKELKELEKEKLRLEIQLKKLELQTNR